ncbi:MAG: sugar transferase, partial [Weeksellaceae bacterium]|nr:sugar transferase [Weeksellaceae bacterium]
MQKNKPISSTTVAYFIADLILLITVFFVLLFYRYDMKETIPVLIKAHYKALLLLILFWMFSADYLKLYHHSRFSRLFVTFRRIFLHVFLISIALFAISGLKTEDLFPLNMSLLFLLIIFFHLMISRTTGHLLLKYSRKKGYNTSKVIIIGKNDNAINLIELINERKELGLELFQNTLNKNLIENNGLIDLELLEDLLIHNKIDFAYICLGDGLDENYINSVIEVLEKRYVSVGFIPNTTLEIQQSLEINYLDSFPILTYKKYPLDKAFNQFLKRTFDIVLSILTIVLLLWWLLPIIGALIYFSQGSPILFKQKRNGLNGKEFNCFKFRTMKPDKFND